MKHATAAALDRLEPLLARLRALPGLTERKRGIFYRRSSAFLHFHEDPAGMFADVRGQDGVFDRLRVETADEQSALRDEVVQSGLRGRGGAGFPTGKKWQLCAEAPGAAHYIVCNADEGEPGTFKDRVLLSQHADLVIEGMTVAALAIGAKQGFVYLRGEYRYLLDQLEGVLRRRRAAHIGLHPARIEQQDDEALRLEVDSEAATDHVHRRLS